MEIVTKIHVGKALRPIFQDVTYLAKRRKSATLEVRLVSEEKAEQHSVAYLKMDEIINTSGYLRHAYSPV